MMMMMMIAFILKTARYVWLHKISDRGRFRGPVFHLGAEVVALRDNSSSTIVAQVQILDDVMHSGYHS